MRIGVTLGDPAGIGPELIARCVLAAGQDATAAEEQLVVFGDAGVLERAARALGLTLGPDSRRCVVEVTRLRDLEPGRPTAETGRAQVAYLEAAVAAARAGRLDALVTAPIHKAACRSAGFVFPGHTEFLAERLAAGGQVTMLLSGPRLRVALATTHLALGDVPTHLTVDALETTIVQTCEALERDFGVKGPRLAIAGLNPHAGESGLFGDEESRVIEPAIRRARERLGKVVLSGPEVPDAVFRRARLDDPEHAFDAVVALYHDQGLIPVKLIDFDEAVNVTLGLPIIRTSPDHGVAYDLAGTGRARGTSFAAALALARRLAATRRARSR